MRLLQKLLTEGKIEAVKKLKNQYGKLAYVGDGINDAPALAEADIGLAIGTGTDVAIEAADVVLMSGNLKGVPNAIALSKATITNIRENLFWAFVYKCSSDSYCSRCTLSAIWTATFSCICCLVQWLSRQYLYSGNALRLKRFKAPLAII